MEKETYKVAKEILEKYAPEQLQQQKPLAVSCEKLMSKNLEPTTKKKNLSEITSRQ